MNFQIRSDMSCTSTGKKQQPLSLTDGDGRSGNHYYTVTRTNVNLLCWQHIQLFASTLSPLPNLFFFSTALPSAVMSWPWHDQGRMAPKGFLRGFHVRPRQSKCWAPSSQRMLWRPGRQEGAFEKGSQPAHWNIQNGMEVIFKHVKNINIKDPIWAKFLCMPCMLAQDIRTMFVWIDMVVPVDIASVVAFWCIPVEVYRAKKQTGMPSYRLRGCLETCETHSRMNGTKGIKGPGRLSNYPQPFALVDSASARSFKVIQASRSSSTARTSSCRDNIDEPVENNEPTLPTLIRQMELMETLKLWMLLQGISSPCSGIMKGTISVDLSRIHYTCGIERQVKDAANPAYEPEFVWICSLRENKRLCTTCESAFRTSAFAFASVYAANSSSSLLTSSCGAVWDVLDGHPALTPWRM